MAKFLSKAVDVEKQTVTCTLGNGLVVEGKLAEYNADTVIRLALHGLSQKLGDSTSQFSKAEDYHGAFGALQSTADNLLQGLWSVRAGNNGTTDLATAIAELQNMAVADAQELIAQLDDKQFDMVKRHPEVKAKILEIQKRRLETAVTPAESLGDLLGQIGKGA